MEITARSISSSTCCGNRKKKSRGKITSLKIRKIKTIANKKTAIVSNKTSPDISK